MPAYLIVDVDVRDPEAYAEYKRAVPASLAAYGGRFLARGGATETLEGGWKPRRLVLVEFPDIERARAWWDSEEYRRPKALRRAASSANIVLAEGCEPPSAGGG